MNTSNAFSTILSIVITAASTVVTAVSILDPSVRSDPHQLYTACAFGFCGVIFARILVAEVNQKKQQKQIERMESLLIDALRRLPPGNPDKSDKNHTPDT